MVRGVHHRNLRQLRIPQLQEVAPLPARIRLDVEHGAIYSLEPFKKETAMLNSRKPYFRRLESAGGASGRRKSR
jgi:hypothetical protein